MSITRNDLRKLVPLWTDARLDPAFGARLTEMDHRYTEILGQYADVKTAANAGIIDLAGLVVDGELTILEALERHVARSALEVADHLRTTALRIHERRTTAEIAALGDRLITAHLAPREAELYAEAEPQARLLDDVATPEAAFAAGGKITAAWHTVACARDTTEKLTAIRRHLAGASPGEWEHPHLELIPAPEKGRHPVAKFAALVLSGAGPRVLVARDARATRSELAEGSTRAPELDPVA